MHHRFTRIQAFLIHLSASVVVFSSLLFLMFYIWYPEPFFTAEGGMGILKVVGGIDVVLGPLLTLIVFKPGKKSLKFDMTVIVLIQLAALVYGTDVVFEERPGYAVLAKGEFTIVSASQIDTGKHPDKRVGFFSGPRYMVATLPDDPVLRREYENSFLYGNSFEYSIRPELYKPYSENYRLAIDDGLPLSRLTDHSDAYSAEVDRFLKAKHISGKEALYLPIVGKAKNMALVVRKTDGAIIGAIDVDTDFHPITENKG
jgi:hypothetical protein